MFARGGFCTSSVSLQPRLIQYTELNNQCGQIYGVNHIWMAYVDADDSLEQPNSRGTNQPASVLAFPSTSSPYHRRRHVGRAPLEVSQARVAQQRLISSSVCRRLARIDDESVTMLLMARPEHLVTIRHRILLVQCLDLQRFSWLMCGHMKGLLCLVSSRLESSYRRQIALKAAKSGR